MIQMSIAPERAVRDAVKCYRSISGRGSQVPTCRAFFSGRAHGNSRPDPTAKKSWISDDAFDAFLALVTRSHPIPRKRMGNQDEEPVPKNV